MAVVTDAGMPGDIRPRRAAWSGRRRRGVKVEVVPGPSAALTALVRPGWPTDRFCFEGSYRAEAGDGRNGFAALRGETRTSVLYEAPHRVRRTMRDLAHACGVRTPGGGGAS